MKALLGLAILFALTVAGEKIYKVYQKRIPPFKVGECFEVPDISGAPVKVYVVENDMKNMRSNMVVEVEISFLPDARFRVGLSSTFEEIRAENPTKVSCE